MNDNSGRLESQREQVRRTDTLDMNEHGLSRQTTEYLVNNALARRYVIETVPFERPPKQQFAPDREAFYASDTGYRIERVETVMAFGGIFVTDVDYFKILDKGPIRRIPLRSETYHGDELVEVYEYWDNGRWKFRCAYLYLPKKITDCRYWRQDGTVDKEVRTTYDDDGSYVEEEKRFEEDGETVKDTETRRYDKDGNRIE